MFSIFYYCRTPETLIGNFRIIMSGTGENHEWVHEWKKFAAVEFMSNHEWRVSGRKMKLK